MSLLPINFGMKCIIDILITSRKTLFLYLHHLKVKEVSVLLPEVMKTVQV